MERKIFTEQEISKQNALDLNLKRNQLRYQEEMRLQMENFRAELEKTAQQQSLGISLKKTEVKVLDAQFDSKIRYLTQLKNLGVDLTKFLVAENSFTVSKPSQLKKE
jgi:hypothetical protein